MPFAYLPPPLLSLFDQFGRKSRGLLILEAHRQHQEQEIAALGGNDLDGGEGTGDLENHLILAGVAQGIQQVAVVEADLHGLTLHRGGDLIHHTAQRGLAAHGDAVIKADAPKVKAPKQPRVIKVIKRTNP